MAKKHLGRIITFAAVAGAAMGAVSYFLRYKSFHKELEEEFHDFEDEFEEFSDEKEESRTATRTYVSLTPDRSTAPEDTATESAAAEPAEAAEPTADAATDEASVDTPDSASEASADATTIVEDTTA